MKLIHRILDLAPILLAVLAFVLWVAAIWTDDARWCGMAILMTVTTVVAAVAAVS